MCGRFVSATPPDQIAQYFGAEEVSEAVLEPNWNVAPTTDVYTVLESKGVRRLEPVHWGLVPFWAKDVKVGNRMINARVETLAEKSAFKRPFEKRRCIIPVERWNSALSSTTIVAVISSPCSIARTTNTESTLE